MIEAFVIIYGILAVIVIWPMLVCLSISWSIPALVIGYVLEIFWLWFAVLLIPGRKKRLTYYEMLLVGK
jgi:hypothetical protein